MLLIFVKVIIVYVLVLFSMRIMGKRQLGEMQPSELVVTLVIAEVACIPLGDPAIPLYAGIIPIVTLTLLQVLLSLLARKSLFARTALSGRSVIVIDKNGIHYENLKRINVNVDDLIESARSSGYMDLKDIAYAIFETNGNLCVVEKPDIGPTSEEATLPVALIIDGKLMQENLTLTGMGEPEIRKCLLQNGIPKITDVVYMDVRQDGTVYASSKYNTCFIASIQVPGGNNW